MVFKAKYLMSCYWGNNRMAAIRRDQSLPYLEQYRIDGNQFRELFISLTPTTCGSHTPILAGRMFRLLDENKDSLINFKEFVTGMSGMYHGDLTEKLKVLYKLHLPPALSTEEAESALEAAQYFPEDLSAEEDKGASSPDYRYYLQMWANEKESKKETIKDLPKMSQEQFIELCKTLYNMFSEDPVEQELYHAIATVASLLLRIGEVGKKFSGRPHKKPEGNSATSEEESLPSEHKQSSAGEQHSPVDPEHRAGGDMHSGKTLRENQIVSEEGRGEGQGSPSQLLSDDETKDDMSMSSYSMVSTSSLQCEDIADDTVLVGCEAGSPASRYGSTIDTDWSISFEQILASILTETALVNFFEKKVDIGLKIKDQKKMERQFSSSSDYELSSISG
uniref:TBC1 domain family member 9B n=1 Tax=Sarcophilus harrisii TaxID=9305 RepID=G3W7K5_SARHA